MGKQTAELLDHTHSAQLASAQSIKAQQVSITNANNEAKTRYTNNDDKCELLTVKVDNLAANLQKAIKRIKALELEHRTMGNKINN